MKPIKDRHPSILKGREARHACLLPALILKGRHAPRACLLPALLLKKRHARHACLLLALLCLVACQVRRPSGVLSDTQMEDILYDYHIAKAMGDEFSGTDSYKRVLYIESVFRKHGITQADFDSSMVWYSRNPEKMSKVYDKVNTRLKAARDGINQLIALRDHKPQETKPGDSIDVWSGERIYRLTAMPLGNKLAFSIPADSNFQARDTLRWTLRLRFPRDLRDSLGTPADTLRARYDTLHAPIISLQLAYETDTLISQLRQVFSPGTETLCLAADTLGSLKTVSGFVYYPTEDPTALLLVDRISLMRYHARDSLLTQPADSLAHEGAQPADSLAGKHEATEASGQKDASPRDEKLKPQEPDREAPRRPRNRPRPVSGTEKVPLQKADIKR